MALFEGNNYRAKQRSWKSSFFHDNGRYRLEVSKGKIAVFQAFHPVQSQLGYTVKCLAEAGYQVDLFLSQCTMEYFQINEEKGVRIHAIDNLGVITPRRRFKSIIERAKSLIEQSKLLPMVIRQRALFRRIRPEFMLPGASRLIPSMLIDKAMSVIQSDEYLCLIGVEKAGLVWAGLVGERTGLPWIYYSLELYTSDNKYVTSNSIRYKRAEKQYHQKAIATIIQDKDRSDVIFKDNEVINGRALFVPVSILAKAAKKRCEYLRKRYSISDNKVIVLYFGQISEWRLCEEIMLEARDFNDETVLIIHGKLSSDRDKYLGLAVDGKVIISDRLVPDSEIGQLIGSAGIGLVFYRESILNEYLTGSASEKLALYLQAGVPVIMFDYPSFRKLNDKYQFGVCIRELKELPIAIETIGEDYSLYRNNAFAAFLDHYEFRSNFKTVLDFIESLEKIT